MSNSLPSFLHFELLLSHRINFIRSNKIRTRLWFLLAPTLDGCWSLFVRTFGRTSRLRPHEMCHSICLFRCNKILLKSHGQLGKGCVPHQKHSPIEFRESS